jgi:hypothetical protein
MNAQQMALQDIGVGQPGLGVWAGAAVFRPDLGEPGRSRQQAAAVCPARLRLQAQLWRTRVQHHAGVGMASMAAARNRAAEFGLTQDFNAQSGEPGRPAGCVSAMRLKRMPGRWLVSAIRRSVRARQVQAGMDQQGRVRSSVRWSRVLLQGAAQGQFDASTARSADAEHSGQMLGAISGARQWARRPRRTPGLFDYLTLAANTAGSAASGGMFNKAPGT